MYLRGVQISGTPEWLGDFECSLCSDYDCFFGEIHTNRAAQLSHSLPGVPTEGVEIQDYKYWNDQPFCPL